MATPKPSIGPTDPGGGSSSATQQEFERGWNQGYFAGLRACPPGHSHAAKPSCCQSESPLSKFLLGLALGFVPGLLMGLFMGLFLALSFRP